MAEVAFNDVDKIYGTDVHAVKDLTLEAHDAMTEAAGLELAERWATWDRVPWRANGDYAVSVHRRSG